MWEKCLENIHSSTDCILLPWLHKIFKVFSLLCRKCWKQGTQSHQALYSRPSAVTYLISSPRVLLWSTLLPLLQHYFCLVRSAMLARKPNLQSWKSETPFMFEELGSVLHPEKIWLWITSLILQLNSISDALISQQHGKVLWTLVTYLIMQLPSMSCIFVFTKLKKL